MAKIQTSRRTFLGVTGLASILTGIHTGTKNSGTKKDRYRMDRLGVGAIGLRYQGTVIANQARRYGDIVALADVDRNVREQARAGFDGKPRIFEDYQDLLARKDVDVVTIGTPDHWHVKMAIDACRAGKDVYVEKPLTLTIDEGKQLREVVEETGRVVQVGSWQRSDHRFRLAVEMVRQGRIGELRSVDVVLGKNKTGGPFELRKPPSSLNWHLWQGQTPNVPYLEERCHYTFRWWQEYSGGQMTDWGAHHLDIAQWAINAEPVEVEGSARFPNVNNGFNVPTNFHVRFWYPGDITLTVRDEGRNGILFTGSEGRIFVNRGTISGKPVEKLADRPMTRESFQLYEDNQDRPQRTGKLDAIINHMGNFFDCVSSRTQPISDFESQHRSVSACHMGNISMRLNRRLNWDPVNESFLDAPDANALLKREQRDGFEVI